MLIPPIIEGMLDYRLGCPSETGFVLINDRMLKLISYSTTCGSTPPPGLKQAEILVVKHGS
jgi:hypothetical protein